MDSRLASEVSISDLFEQFIEASTMRNILSIHHRILNYADLDPCEFNEFFPKLKRAVLTSRQRKNWKAKALFSKIDKRAAQKCYSNNKVSASSNTQPSDNQQVNAPDSILFTQSNNRLASTINNNNALHNYNCLVIGSGPAGLRTAIELQLLGASKVVIVEKRSRFSRNNVLHLWPFVIDDLKSLGAKKFYGKFCAGSIDHISIRQLQLILLKVCLMIGCDFRDSCSYLSLCPSSIKQPHNSTATINLGNSSDINDINRLSDNIKQEEPISKCELYKFDSNKEDYLRVSSSLSEQNSEKDVSNDVGIEVANENIKNYSQNVSATSRADNSVTYSNRVTNLASNGQPSLSRCLNLYGARAHFECESRLNECQLHDLEWDFIIGADGRRNTLSKFFPRKEFRGRLAIAITANFINRQTTAETSIPEISGLSFIYNQDMFNALACDTNIQLENICYYKDDTHYFVMTAKKKSLLERGVLLSDYATTQDLLSETNVNRDALLKYAKDAAYWTTGLEPLDFALNHYGQEDCALFDFTSMYAASNACKAIRTQKGGLALVSLVGDSLLEPFWPTGSGCARGFLSSFDAAWMCRQWAVNRCPVIDYNHGTSLSRSSKSRNSTGGQRGERGHHEELNTYNRMALSVMAERESIYRILAQTTSENLQQNYSHWTLNPHTRYPNLNRHLVLPSQVEHLITDHELKSNIEPGNLISGANPRGRRSKSPNLLSPRKSPKKLKSANASPLTEPKNSRNRSKSLSKQQFKSRSRPEISDEDAQFKLEESYRSLVEDKTTKFGLATKYLSHRAPDCDNFDDLFKPSLSGTLPSSNNLLNLEAGRARDIDECLRQRRQKTKINFVREQLIGQLRGHSVDLADGDSLAYKHSSGGGGNVALFNELKRLREQRARGGTARPESKPRECGPLTLLASMRRCASFAERVKSFESKLSTNCSGLNESHQVVPGSTANNSAASTPRTPIIDNVKNLPQFATLQELFVNSSSLADDGVRKSKIPITKLSKDDWNVRCWEKRLGNYDDSKMRICSTRLGGSVKNLSGARGLSMDGGGGGSAYRSLLATPKKQVEVFQDRIKEMAEKLKVGKEANRLAIQENQKENCTVNVSANKGARSQGWINHLKRELVKGSSSSGSPIKQAMNPVLPNKPIKKLFEDDDEEDDGIDANKHYDHLCINRPVNKYLSKGSAYTSHLTRTRYDRTNSKPINSRQTRPAPTASQNKQIMHQRNATNTDKTSAVASSSRGSSTSSSGSDYSTHTTGNSSLGGGSIVGQRRSSMSVIDVECSRCQRFVSSVERITMGQYTLHRNCLGCARCGISLRSNELLYYLSRVRRNPALVSKEAASRALDKSVSANESEHGSSFTCAICEPSVRIALNEADEFAEPERQQRPADVNLANKPTQLDVVRSRLQSRENFFTSRIDYNELYKNILAPSLSLSRENPGSKTGQQDQVAGPKRDDASSADESKVLAKHYEPNGEAANHGSGTDEIASATTRASSSASNSSFANRNAGNIKRLVTPSPIQVTLPLEIVSEVEAPLVGLEAAPQPQPTTTDSLARLGNPSGTDNLEDDYKHAAATIGTTGYRIAHSETIDGSEQVTLVLPIDGRPVSAMAEPIDDQPKRSHGRRTMIDEDEFERIHYLDTTTTTATTRRLSSRHSNTGSSSNGADKGELVVALGSDEQVTSSSESDSGDDLVSARTFDHNNGNKHENHPPGSSDEASSSLSTPPSGDEQDDDQFGDQSDAAENSTYEDLATSEEFDATSDRDDRSNGSGEHHHGGHNEAACVDGRSALVGSSNEADQMPSRTQPKRQATASKIYG